MKIQAEKNTPDVLPFPNFKNSKFLLLYLPCLKLPHKKPEYKDFFKTFH